MRSADKHRGLVESGQLPWLEDSTMAGEGIMGGWEASGRGACFLTLLMVASCFSAALCSAAAACSPLLTVTTALAKPQPQHSAAAEVERCHVSVCTVLWAAAVGA